MFTITERITPGRDSESPPFDSWDFRPRQAGATPILFVPGWGKTPRAYRGLIELLVQRYRIRVISLASSSRNAERTTDDPGCFPLPQMNQARAILALLEKKRLPPVDVVTHSQGNLSALIAASIRPERFRNFVLHGCPGFTGRESHARILWRMSCYLRETVLTGLTVCGDQAIGFQQVQQDTWRWIRERSHSVGLVTCLIEAMNPGRLSVVDTAQHLRSLGHGIVAVIPERDVMIRLRPSQVVDSASIGLDEVKPIPGCHDQVCFDFERYGRLTVRILERLQARPR